jgi:hypothetical protein
MSALWNDRPSVYVDRFSHRRLKVIAGPDSVATNCLVQGDVNRRPLRNGKEIRPVGIDPCTCGESSGQNDGSPIRR